jgi:hypothetical protein
MAIDAKKPRVRPRTGHSLEELDEFVGVLSTGGKLGQTVRELRQEWDDPARLDSDRRLPADATLQA